MYEKVKDLLQRYALNDEVKQNQAIEVTKNSLKMNHLYQDMGFSSRTQMGKYMQTYFPRLAEKKPKDKLWKKYIYDLVGEVAPACATCDDQETCFRCSL